MKLLRIFLSLTIYLAIANNTFAQKFINDVIDSATATQLLTISQKFGNLTFSGYMQPQFQIASEKGTDAEYQGGAFASLSDNRFRLRRGRLKADYMHRDKNGDMSTYFVFQFDGTEQGVNVRDFWGRYYENKLKMFYFTTGIFARPFGYELQLSSTFREAPERGRMSQILMKTERDLGFNITFNPRDPKSKIKNLRVDLGVFNGQGLAGPREYDNFKDLIGRVSLQPANLGENFKIAGGASILYGGIQSESTKLHTLEKNGAAYQWQTDSATTNIGKTKPRHYYGTDIQLSTVKNSKWISQLRLEYIGGVQTATFDKSNTPGSYPLTIANPANAGLYTRNFNGGYFTFIQNLGSKSTQLIAKMDFYDPNTKVKGLEIKEANGFSAADVKYTTFGFGLLHHLTPHLKIVGYFDYINNEKTGLKNFDKDVKDNVFTLRAQFTF